LGECRPHFAIRAGALEVDVGFFGKTTNAFVPGTIVVFKLRKASAVSWCKKFVNLLLACMCAAAIVNGCVV